MRRTRNRRHNGGLSLNPLNWFKSKEEEAPMANPPPMPEPIPPAQGGKRKNRCNWAGGYQLTGAPIGYDQVRAMGGQPSEKIMQAATTAGGRRKSRRRSHRKHRSHWTRRNHKH